jgi:hypothetical protein
MIIFCIDKLYQNKRKSNPKFNKKFIDGAYVNHEYESDYDEIVEFNKQFNQNLILHFL